MKLVDREILFESERFQVYKDNIILDGIDLQYTYLNKGNAVGIIAYNLDEIILVEQYRHSIGRRMLEIPGGRIESGESAQETAFRELKEETGLVANDFQLLTGAFVHPSLCNEEIFIFTTTKFQEFVQSLEKSEQNLIVKKVKIDQIPTLLLNNQVLSMPDAFALSLFYFKFHHTT